MSLSFRIRSGAQQAGPIGMLVISLGLAAWLHGSLSRAVKARGFAEEETWTAASTELGRVASVSVRAGERVSAGQVIATLDTHLVDAQLALVEAERTRLIALLPATQAGMTVSIEEEIRTLERELASEEEALALARSEASTLKAERERLEKLVAGKLATGTELSDISLKYAGVAPLVEQKPKRIALLRKQLETAKNTRKQVLEVLSSGETAAVGKELLKLSMEREEFLYKRGEMTIRAPSDGYVSVVLKRAGEVAAPGEVITTLVGVRSRVTICVGEHDALKVAEGARVKLVMHEGGGPSLTGTLSTVSPSVMELPLRCRLVPNRPVWGRIATAAIEGQAGLVPGQAFDVEIDTSGAPKPLAPLPPVSSAAVQPIVGASAQILPSAMDSMVLPMRVPAQLSQKTRFEPSGVLCQKELGRCWVVSDDTGLESANERAPWLFSMSPEGVVNPEPVVIQGLKEVNDLESIAALDSGNESFLYVLASQGHSKNKKRPPSRTAFLRLRVKDGMPHLDTELHLSELLDKQGAPANEKLGLSQGTADLDIEGMSAYGGALYLGVKSPLDSEGRALIWKISDPDALFKEKSLEKAGLSLWARVRLEAEVDGKAVPGGISELLFWPDGSLALSSTASRDEGKSESGRLWYVASPRGGVLEPRAIRLFPGRKPEGLSRVPDPSKMLVIFDEGEKTPSLVEVAWPPP